MLSNRFPAGSRVSNARKSRCCGNGSKEPAGHSSWFIPLKSFYLSWRKWFSDSKDWEQKVLAAPPWCGRGDASALEGVKLLSKLRDWDSKLQPGFDVTIGSLWSHQHLNSYGIWGKSLSNDQELWRNQAKRPITLLLVPFSFPFFTLNLRTLRHSHGCSHSHLLLLDKARSFLVFPTSGLLLLLCKPIR